MIFEFKQTSIEDIRRIVDDSFTDSTINGHIDVDILSELMDKRLQEFFNE